MTEFTQASRFLFPDDGMVSTAAERWVRKKIGVIRQYLTAYVMHMAGKVDDIVFLDLYAGNGLYSLGSQKELFPASAMMSLSIDLPIAKYVFCESDPERSKILKIRVNKYFRTKNVVLLEGRPEDLIEKIRMYIPPSKGDYRSATICLCDPFSIEMPFEVIQKLAEHDFTFLIPFTFAVNDRLDYRFYLDENRKRLKRFLGTEDLGDFGKGIESNVQYYKKLVRAYENKLMSMGFNGCTSVHKQDSGLMELPMYYVGLFSRHASTKIIQGDVEASRQVQFELFNS